MAKLSIIVPLEIHVHSPYHITSVYHFDFVEKNVLCCTEYLQLASKSKMVPWDAGNFWTKVAEKYQNKRFSVDNYVFLARFTKFIYGW